MDRHEPSSKLAAPTTRTPAPPQELIYSSGPTDIDDDGLLRERSHEAATITDLHNSSNVAEVEIISLLEEKIPLYKLRADTASGYAYDDWMGSSLGSVAEEEQMEEGRYDLSPEMMEETLKYFTLCGDRVVQMTKTYNDIDAVTRLLEEKEKDLELAAKIGQSLLQQNKQLEIRIESLEEQTTVLGDQNTQLRHDIKLKNELLQIYTNDYSYSDSEDDSSWSGSKPVQQPTFINVDTLQKKVRNLEEENLHLRIETADLRTSTTSIEEKEQELMHDCVKQLGDAQGRESILAEELSKKYEENARQQEEMTNLLAQVVDLQTKVKKLTIENEDMHQHLQASKESQQELTEEIQDLRDKYDECHEMLIESQEAVKQIHRRSLPQGKVPSYSSLNPLPVFPLDSLAAELVNTVEQELGVEQHLTGKGKRDYNRSVMKTVKAANKRPSSRQSSLSDYSADMYSRQTSPGSSLISLCGSPRSEQYEGDNESMCSPTPVGMGKQLGKPGIPGSNDLEMALRRLSLRRQNKEAERKYRNEEKERLLTASDIEESEGETTPTCLTPGTCSIWSGGESLGYLGSGAHNFKAFMPEKLQIVKPMEGSMTLYHWQRLATPHMASMLDSRPGVAVKGFREIDEEDEMFSLDDLEDDGIFRSTIPSKCFVNTSSTYTYTTSNIDLLDNTSLTSSSMRPKMSSVPHVSTIDNATRTRSTSTFSTCSGLAQVLHERDAPKTPTVLLKAEASCAPSPRKANLGLNFLSAGRQLEKKAEMSTMPGGVHQVRRGIISRNATPVLTGTAAKILDQDTKERLMEKVKAIRAEKHQEHVRRLSMSESTGIHTKRTTSITMSSVVSKSHQISPEANLLRFKTGMAPGFGRGTSHLLGTTTNTPPSNSQSSGLNTLTGVVTSTDVNMSTGAIPKVTPSYSQTYTSAMPTSSLHYSSSSMSTQPSVSSHYTMAAPPTGGYSSTGPRFASCTMPTSSLLYSSSGSSARPSVIPLSTTGAPPTGYASNTMSSSSLLYSSSGSSARPSVIPLSTTVAPPSGNASNTMSSSSLLYSSSATSARPSVIPISTTVAPPTGFASNTMSSSSLLYSSSGSSARPSVIPLSTTVAPPTGFASNTMSSSSLTYSSSSMSSRPSVIPPNAPTVAPPTSVNSSANSSSKTPSGLISSSSSRPSVIPPSSSIAPPTKLPIRASSDASCLGLAAVGSLNPKSTAVGTAGISRAAIGSLQPQGTAGGLGLGMIGSLSTQSSTVGVGLGSIGSLNTQSSGVGLGAIGSLSPQGASGGVGLAALGARSPQGVASPMTVLSGNLNLLKNRHPSGHRL